MADLADIAMPTREAGLDRLAEFLPRAGRAYAARRNHDLPGHAEVSRLSPWLRHRLVTEAEVMDAAIAQHGVGEAEKFLQEVLWRSYWKGWLEMRPGVWAAYRQGLGAALNRVQTEAGLRAAWEAACAGDTGIDGFDDWARELAASGYLHNHARMWFASIWVFTLSLPWELGADFFLRHLLDGDPASNTLSWRWVAGLQTAGKTYLARADNIAQFTGGRFRPGGLAKEAAVPRAEPTPAPRPIEQAKPFDPACRTVFLLHEDDLSPGFLFDLGLSPVATALLAHPEGRSPLVVSDRVIGFSRGAVEDAARRWSARLGEVRGLEADPAPDALADWVAALRAEQVVSAHAPVGPVARRLSALEAALAARGIPVIRQMRDEDAAAWPHATHGFFRFWEAMRP
jgi:deoxyribodipyrimidine photo-lyase